MSRGIILFAFALANGSAISAQPPPTTLTTVSSAPALDGKTQAEDVAFRNGRDDRMTVAVKLSGSGPYRFLVDTGADRTAVSSELVSKLKLESGTGVELHSAAGVSSVGTAKLQSLELTRIADKSIEAAVLDSVNIGADGIVGVDVLRSRRVQFDFEKQTMSIVPSAAPDFRAEPGTIVVEARRRNGRLIVTNAVANGQDLTVIIDTGSQVSIGNQALRKRLLGHALIGTGEKVELECVTGEKIIGDYILVRDMQIGDIALKDLPVVFTDAHTFKQLNLDKKPALLLGMNAIRAFKRVSIDFANRKFRVVVPEHSEIETQVALAQAQ
jgi:predicted aspartyl protease